MIPQKRTEEVAMMQKGGKILGQILKQLSYAVYPGQTTAALNNLAEKLIARAGGSPSFKGYAPLGTGQAYPKALCCSINDEVVHGIPSDKRRLKKGDIISLDLGLYYQGWHTDSALTLGVGKISPQAERLIRVTREALQRGIEQVKVGATIGDLGAAIQNYVENHGYSVVKSLVGHGIGREVHESPRVPNFGQRGQGAKLTAGNVIAIEPMVNLGREEVITAVDNWTVKSSDHSLSAHFEHTVAVTESGYLILTLP